MQKLSWVIIGALVASAFLTGPVVVSGGAGDNYERGKGFLHSGRYDEAIEAFSSALTISDAQDRNMQVVTLARAQAYLAKGDRRNAWLDLNSVLQSGRLDGETKASGIQIRAMLHLREGRDNKALEDFTEAIKTPHDNHSLRSATFANRGMTLINLGETDRAIGDLNKAIELNAESAYAYAVRGLAYLRRDNIELAKRDADTAMSLQPDEQAKKIADGIIKELSIQGSGPLSVTLPLTESGHIFVQVRFTRNGKPHRFLLDTGATHTLISKEILQSMPQEAEVSTIGKGTVQLADGSTHMVTRYRIKKAFIYHLPLGEIEAHVFDRTIPSVMNLLGTRSIRNISVNIDNAGKTVQIKRKESFD